MSQIRKRHSAAFKAKVGVAALKGEETMAGMVSQFQVHSSWISVWRRELIEGAEAFLRMVVAKTMPTRLSLASSTSRSASSR